MTCPQGYSMDNKAPDVRTYRALRVGAGLSDKSDEAARLGLAGTLFAVRILHGDQVVGMGRLIGDGGCFFQVVDIAVLPRHQGKGLGKAVMAAISAYIRSELPEGAYVSLIADGPAKHLYEHYGFKATAPISIGMALTVCPERGA